MKPLFYLINNITRSNFGRMQRPYKLTFIVTYKCNLHCKMCNIWCRKDQRPELNMIEIEKFFNKCNFFSWVNVSGGEIFLRPDITDIVGVIIKSNKNLYLLDFPTNGFASDTIVSGVSKILKFKPKRLFVTISLDGPEQLHNELRGHSDAWQRAVKTFKELERLSKHNRNMKVFFGLTLMPYNMNSLKETFDAVKAKIPDIDKSSFHVNIAHSSEHYYANKDSQYIAKAPSFELLDDFLKTRKYGIGPVGFLEKKYQRLVKDYFEKTKTPLACKALSSSCFIDPFGDVFPCSIYNRPIGNIKNSNLNFKEIWNSEAALVAYNDIKKGLCPQCWTPCEAYQTILGNLFKL